MKSIKTNSKSAKVPDKMKIANKLYCILSTTLELTWLYFFRKKPLLFIILVSNLKEISPSVFSWKTTMQIYCQNTIRPKKILNYAYVLKNGVLFFIFTQSLLNPPFCVVFVNVFVCAMCIFFNKQFCTCAIALPNEFTV